MTQRCTLLQLVIVVWKDFMGINGSKYDVLGYNYCTPGDISVLEFISSAAL
jgi:hypothetical protein